MVPTFSNLRFRLTVLVTFVILATAILATRDYALAFYFLLGAFVLGAAAIFFAFEAFVAGPLRRLKGRMYDFMSRGLTLPPVPPDDSIVGLNNLFEHLMSQIMEKKAKVTEMLETFRRAEEAAHLGAWRWEIASGRILWSDGVFRVFGLDPASFEPTYDLFLQAVHPEDRPLVQRAVDLALHGRAPYSVEHRILRPDGSTRWVHESGVVERDSEGRPVFMVGTVVDITERRESERLSRFLSEALEHSASIVFVTNEEGVIEWVNRAFVRITGYSKAEAIGSKASLLKSGKHSNDFCEEMWNTIKSGRIWRGVVTNRRKDGRLYDVKSVILPVIDDHGRFMGFLAVQEDLSREAEVARREKALATVDRMSGLLNRQGLLHELDRWIQVNRGHSGALLLADLDHFRFINEAMGPAAADRVLLETAKVFEAAVKGVAEKVGAKPLVARMYGDEYGAFIPGLSADRAIEAAEEVRRRIEEQGRTKGGHMCTASIGVVMFPTHGTNIGDLLARADAALYQAKAKGRNRVHLFGPEDQDIENMRARLRLRQEIIEALDEGRIVPFFQPVLDIASSSIRHFEALARMAMKDGSYLTPFAFIEAAVGFGLIGRIDLAILDATIEIAKRVRQAASFGVNLSGKDIADEGFRKAVIEKVRASGLEKGSLVFEVTETEAVRDIDHAIAFMDQLRALGCKVALDDFGVGFSSFNYLKRLPVDMVKIDGSFIKNIARDPTDRRFVQAIVEVCRFMAIRTVAEFVEDKETLEILRDLKVDMAQGYYIGRPAPEPVWDFPQTKTPTGPNRLSGLSA